MTHNHPWLAIWTVPVLWCALWCDSLPSCAQGLHTLQVVDSVTGRGVPLVEVSIGGQPFITDSGGIVALNNPALLNQSVSIQTKSYGYEILSSVVQSTTGGMSQLPIVRTNLAERIYRITGTGIYQESVAAGRPTPISHPLLNANVRGQDSVQAVVYQGEIHWFWGDTLYENGFGNFRTAGATSELPGQGGLPPSAGINLQYFVDSGGSAREMMPSTSPGPIWIDGLFTVPQPNGQEKMLAHFVRVQSFSPYVLYEQGLAIYDDVSDKFLRFRGYDLNAPLTAAGHSFRYDDGNGEYIYFAQSYPNVRVRSTWEDVSDIQQWEAFTPLRPNTRYNAANPPLDLDASGQLVYGWKKNTDPLTPEMIAELEQNGYLTRAETPFRLTEYGSGRELRLHRSSVHWNDYRQSWIMIGTEVFGDSLLGEIWFSESSSPSGPWESAVKVVTHDDGTTNDYSFYNPTSHPFFDEEGGRIIYFEGTYTHTFSGNPNQTALYDYNQIMYRLDLATIPHLLENPRVDLDGNSSIDCHDADALIAEILSDEHHAYFDANGDGVVNQNDLTLWLARAGALLTANGGAFLPGDANLDGVVDVTDFNQWNSHRQQPTASWCQGDFNADGMTDVLDFNIWNQNKFRSTVPAAVPESTSLSCLMAAVSLFGQVRVGRRLGIPIKRPREGEAPAEP